MTTSTHSFADRLLNIAVTGSLIRLEFGTLQAPAEEGQKPQLVTTQTLVMPLDGFLPSFGIMDTIVKKLVADGVIKLQAPQGSPPAAAA